MVQHFIEAVAMDLKQWFSSPNIWLLNLIDHFSQYNVSVLFKKREKRILSKKVFQHRICKFGQATKFLVHNGGEFCGNDLLIVVRT